MAGPLSDARHEKFCQLFVSGKSKIDAYEGAGFSRDRFNASKITRRPEVAARIKELQSGAAERVEITQAMVLAELAKIGFSDIRKLFTENGGLRRVETLDDDAAACLASVEVVTRRVPGSDREEPEYEDVKKIRLWDKRAALVDIGKHLGMFTEKVEHTGPNGGPIEVEVPIEEAARRIAFLLSAADRAGK